MNPLASMTGFAQAQRESPAGRLTVILKTLNHRYLDLRWQLPAACEPALPELDRLLRAGLHRGHVEVRVQWQPAATADGPLLNETQVAAWLAAHAELARRLGAPATPAVADLLRVPGVFNPEGSGAGPATALVLDTARQALTELARMRQQEGAALAAAMLALLATMARSHGELAALQSGLEAEIIERLRARLAALTDGGVPEHRLMQEAALLAERADISEEITRFEIHLASCRATLAAGGEAGKRLDFLAQELAREANTILSKASGATPAALRAAALGLELKATVEKFREQVQNLE